MKNKKSNITGLILSAGLSSRIGNFKPLIKFNNKSFIENIVSKLDPICEKIIIVTGFNEQEIVNHIQSFSDILQNKIEIIHNKSYELGMYSSLQKGLKNITNSWVVYHFVDQPNIPNQFYLNFINQINTRYNWIQPSYNKMKGHPIIFGEEVVLKILQSSKYSNLREISSQKEIKKLFWKCQFKEILNDIDTLEDLNKIKDYKNA